MTPLRRFLFAFGLASPTPSELAVFELAHSQRALLVAEANLENAKAHRDVLVVRIRRLSQAAADLTPKEPS